MRDETHAPASTHIIQCSKEETVLTKEERKVFKSGVGLLLCLLKHLCLGLSNSVQELSKVMDRANGAHKKSLYRVISFIKETQQQLLLPEPKNEEVPWELKGYSDSDFPGDSDNRKSEFCV